MSMKLIIFAMTFGSIICGKPSGVSPDETAARSWKNYIDSLEEIYEKYKEDSESMKEVGESRSIGLDFFNVKFETDPDPVTVHSLRPNDIDVVASLGDSITAGTGIDARTIAGLAVQFRGLSWTVGGDQELESSLTIPNILRRFNPEVKGYSVGRKFDFDVVENDWFNVAVPGARARDMVSQTRTLIDLMKADDRTSFENDWKLISIFIGGNDLCALDRDPDGASPETYVDHLREALDIMHEEIPRALVQITQIMEVYLLPQVSSGYGAANLCNLTQELACGVVVEAVKDPNSLQELKEINWRYQSLTEELVDSGRYDTRDDFTVVIQPFFKDTELPLTDDNQVDSTYFAPDCFHFSSKGHALGALNLWNNMLEPVGKKSTKWDIKDLSCPALEQPHIFTSKNSPVEEIPTDTPTNHPITCAPLNCKTTPDWVIGVISALAAVIILQVLLLLWKLQSLGKRRKKTYSGSTKSNSSATAF